jgi:hypothetical protein
MLVKRVEKGSPEKRNKPRGASSRWQVGPGNSPSSVALARSPVVLQKYHPFPSQAGFPDGLEMQLKIISIFTEN